MVTKYFNDFFDNDWMVKANATAPAINVIESDKDYKVEVAAPGMTKEDFKIHINEDNDLVISMEKKTESTEGDKEGKKESRYLRREFSYSKFQQTLILPDDVDKDKLMQSKRWCINYRAAEAYAGRQRKAAKVIEVK